MGNRAAHRGLSKSVGSDRAQLEAGEPVGGKSRAPGPPSTEEQLGTHVCVVGILGPCCGASAVESDLDRARRQLLRQSQVQGTKGLSTSHDSGPGRPAVSPALLAASVSTWVARDGDFASGTNRVSCIK